MEKNPAPRYSAGQYSLGTLLLIVLCLACAAAYLRFLTQLPGWDRHIHQADDWWFAGFLLICMLGSISLGWFRHALGRATYGSFAWAAVVHCGLVSSSIACGLGIWYTEGEVAAFAILFCSLVTIITGVILANGEFRSCTIGSLLLFGLLLPTVFVPQTQLLVRLKDMQREVTSVASYLEAEKQTHGVYPATLAGYTFVAPRWQSLFDYEPTELHDDYVLSFQLSEADTTGRSYTPSEGWWYYPE